ncbi:MAG: hypothetical protein B7Y55_13510 [Polynucleobacter sp. 35-46-207]|nr:MAG: hypothetical protein B7Y55_13510 [Polynucleobacter sp. 35-46-207]OZB40091.1 MAG: hypothetical protein B7X60_11795 [Polynucleobacter sp. 39-45-136]
MHKRDITQPLSNGNLATVLSKADSILDTISNFSRFYIGLKLFFELSFIASFSHKTIKNGLDGNALS